MTRFTIRVAAVAMALAVAFGASACSWGKPGKDELRSALLVSLGGDVLEGEAKAQREKLADCLVDQLHGAMSAEGLKKLIEAMKDPEVDPEGYKEFSEQDQKAIEDAGATCQPA